MVMKPKGLLWHMFLLALLDLDCVQHTITFHPCYTNWPAETFVLIHSVWVCMYSLRKRPHFLMPPLVSPRSDVWETTTGIPYWWCVTNQTWIVLLIGWSKFSTNQKHYPDLGGDTLSVWNFCGHFPDIISQGNQWLHCEMSAVFSGFYMQKTEDSAQSGSNHPT